MDLEKTTATMVKMLVLPAQVLKKLRPCNECGYIYIALIHFYLSVSKCWLMDTDNI